MMSSPSVALNTPVSGPFPHHMSLHYSPIMTPNGLNGVGAGNGKPLSDASNMPWCSPSGYPGVTGGYAPGTAYPFPPISQPLDSSKNGRKKGQERVLKQEEDDDMDDMENDDQCGSSLGLNAG